MPGVLILEAMAQVGAVAIALSMPEYRRQAGLSSAVSRTPGSSTKVTPGDVVVLELHAVTIVRRVGPVGVRRWPRASVDGKVAATGGADLCPQRAQGG